MTKKQRRDKESSAKSHRQKIIGRRSSIADVAARSAIWGGIVNLARRWLRGKVAKKARIRGDWVPVVWVGGISGGGFGRGSEVWGHKSLNPEFAESPAAEHAEKDKTDLVCCFIFFESCFRNFSTVIGV